MDTITLAKSILMAIQRMEEIVKEFKNIPSEILFPFDQIDEISCSTLMSTSNQFSEKLSRDISSIINEWLNPVNIALQKKKNFEKINAELELGKIKVTKKTIEAVKPIESWRGK